MTTRTIVLLGLGHTNVAIVRAWQRRAVKDVEIVGVSNFPIATYSGMLPGTLAGQYQSSQMQIDLARLCQGASARLIVDEVVGLDVAGRRLLLKEHLPLSFDALSIGVGSAVALPNAQCCRQTLLPIKPMQTFLERLEERLYELQQSVTFRPLRLAVVGGGAGGIEMALCLQARLTRLWEHLPVELTVVDAGRRLVPDLPRRAGECLTALLEARGVRLYLNRRVTGVGERVLDLDDGGHLASDLALWATGAVAPPVLAKFALPKDDRGFLRTRPTLQTLADAPIFAVGDCGTIDSGTINGGTIDGAPAPKAGVYAVRQAPVLWSNLRNQLNRHPLKPFRPQRDFLKLLNTGDGKALIIYRGAVMHARWCWKLKDAIDRTFVAKYQS